MSNLNYRSASGPKESDSDVSIEYIPTNYSEFNGRILGSHVVVKQEPRPDIKPQIFAHPSSHNYDHPLNLMDKKINGSGSTGAQQTRFMEKETSKVLITDRRNDLESKKNNLYARQKYSKSIDDHRRRSNSLFDPDRGRDRERSRSKSPIKRFRSPSPHQNSRSHMDTRKPPIKYKPNWKMAEGSLPKVKNAPFNPGKVYQDRIVVSGKESHFEPIVVDQEKDVVPMKESRFEPIAVAVDHSVKSQTFKDHQTSNAHVPIYQKAPVNSKRNWNPLKEAMEWAKIEEAEIKERNDDLFPVRRLKPTSEPLSKQSSVRHPVQPQNLNRVLQASNSIEPIYYDVSSDSEPEDIDEKLQNVEPMTNDSLNVEVAKTEVIDELHAQIQNNVEDSINPAYNEVSPDFVPESTREEFQMGEQMHEVPVKREPQIIETILITGVETDGNLSPIYYDVSSDSEPEDNHEELQSVERIPEKSASNEQIESVKSHLINYPTGVNHDSSGMELVESQMNKETSSMENVEPTHMHEELSTIQVDVEEQCIEQGVNLIEQSVSEVSQIPSYVTQCFVLTNVFDSESQKVANWELRIRSDVMNECKTLTGEDVTVFIDKKTCGILIKCSSTISAYTLVNHLDEIDYGDRTIGAFYCSLERFDRSLIRY